MDCAPFKIPSHLAGDFSYRSVIPPLRKKSRLLRLCPCKRGHDASAALPTFCGIREGSNFLLKGLGILFIFPFHQTEFECGFAFRLSFFILLHHPRINLVFNNLKNSHGFTSIQRNQKNIFFIPMHHTESGRELAFGLIFLFFLLYLLSWPCL